MRYLRRYELALALAWTLSSHTCTGQVEIDSGDTNTEGNTVLPIDPNPVPGTSFRPASQTRVRWEGREYNVDRGIRVLTEVITDEKADPARREKALDVLGHLNTQLRGSHCIAELVQLYPNLGIRELKGGALLCLWKSEDSRALPLFHRVLDEEKDDLVRLFAGGGLARWNIRTGVEELAKLFDSELLLPSKRTLGEEALGVFDSLARTKGWGFPENEIREQVVRMSTLSAEEKAQLWRQRHKDWFEENKERFPDWKSGDPLPHIDAPAEQNGGAPPVLKDEEFPNDTLTLMDSESGELFVIPTTELKPYPMPNPKTRKNTLYRTEICYWGEECRKRGGTRVIMNTLLGKPEPTHCPVCGHVVRFHNPRPEDHNPSDQAENDGR